MPNDCSADRDSVVGNYLSIVTIEFEKIDMIRTVASTKNTSSHLTHLCF
jgi:hypothetical protein